MQRTREGTDRKDRRCRDRRDQQCTCKEDGSGEIRHGIESGVTMVTQGFRDAALYHMSAKDTLHDVGITGITTFGTGIAFDILSRPVQALVRKFRGTVGISGCSEAAEGGSKTKSGYEYLDEQLGGLKDKVTINKYLNFPTSITVENA